MDALRQYVVSITSAAVLCGVLKAMVRKGPSSGIIKILCGTFLAFAFLNPLTDLSLEVLAEPIIPGLEGRQSALEEGAYLSRTALEQEISQRIEEEIIQKAAILGVEVSVDVDFSGDTPPIPIALTITGNVSPYAKIQLEQYIRDELGICKEDLRWIG